MMSVSRSLLVKLSITHGLIDKSLIDSLTESDKAPHCSLHRMGHVSGVSTQIAMPWPVGYP